MEGTNTVQNHVCCFGEKRLLKGKLSKFGADTIHAHTVDRVHAKSGKNRWIGSVAKMMLGIPDNKIASQSLSVPMPLFVQISPVSVWEDTVENLSQSYYNIG